MKILSGVRKGHKILGPGPPHIRPMRQIVRKALFDILQNLVHESVFLDLFAGTGSVGLEALSRGASHVTFVDESEEAVKLISKNLDRLDFTSRAVVCHCKVEDAVEDFARRKKSFDVVFLGPPYGCDFASLTLKRLSEVNIVCPGGVVAVEIFKKERLAENFGCMEKIKDKDYGQNRLIFYRNKFSPGRN